MRLGFSKDIRAFYPACLRSILCRCLSVGLILFLAACGGDTASVTGNEGTVQEEPETPTDDTVPVSIDIPQSPRSYRLGFQSFPYESTLAAEVETWGYISDHADMVMVTMNDGVPWEEMINGDPLPASISDRLDEIELYLNAFNGKSYLAIDMFSPSRTGLAPDSEGRTVPDVVEGASAAEPTVKEAYIRYSELLVERLEPDYFSPMVRLDEYFYLRPSDYEAATETYSDLREEIKDLRVETQVFPTWNLEVLAALTPNSAGVMFNDMRTLDAHSDLVGVVVNPASYLLDAEIMETDVLSQIEEYTVRDVLVIASYPSAGYEAPPIIFPSSEASQYNFLASLLTTAENGNYMGIIWQFPYDIDLYLEALCPGRLLDPRTPCFDNEAEFDLLRPNGSAGLLSPDGNRKTVSDLWNEFYARSYSL